MASYIEMSRSCCSSIEFRKRRTNGPQKTSKENAIIQQCTVMYITKCSDKAGNQGVHSLQCLCSILPERCASEMYH